MILDKEILTKELDYSKQKSEMKLEQNLLTVKSVH